MLVNDFLELTRSSLNSAFKVVNLENQDEVVNGVIAGLESFAEILSGLLHCALDCQFQKGF